MASFPPFSTFLRVMALLSAFAPPLFSQTEIGILQTSHLAQTVMEGNPASFTDFRFNLALPSVYTGVSNTGFQLKEVFQELPNGYRLDPELAFSKMPAAGNLLGLSTSLSAGALSFQIKRKVQFTFFHTTQLHFQLQYPKALPELLWRGNYPFVGQTLSVGPRLDVLGYNAYGGGLALKINPKLRFGTNLKLLTGLVGLQTERSDLQLSTDTAFYQLSVQSDWRVHTGGLNDLSNENTEEVLADTRTSYLINSQNYGYGLDAGIVWQARPKWTLGVAVKDLGLIRWTQHAYTLESKGDFDYEGASIRLFSDENEPLEGIEDSLSQLLEVKGTPSKFESRLPFRFLFTTSWNPTSSLSLGTTLQYRSWYGNSSWYGAAQLQQRLGRVLYLGLLMGYEQRAGIQWGANASLRLGPFQFYALSDHVLPFVDPFSGKGTNLRVGMNLAIGK